MDDVDIIKRDGMKAVLDHYGYTPNRGGYIPCPFHGEKTASLKIYKPGKGWACFGCHAGGSPIDFVMLYEKCSFADAVRLLRGLMGIEQPKHTDPKRQALKRELDGKYAAWRDELKRRNEAAQVLIGGYYDLYRIAQSKPVWQRTTDDWTLICRMEQELPDWESMYHRYKKLEDMPKIEWLDAYSKKRAWTTSWHFYRQPWMQ